MNRKRVYSGICLCGHREDYHWRGMVFDQQIADTIGPYVHGACLALGSNETEGLDEETMEAHCFNYVDQDDPDPDVLSSWKGTKK